MSDTTHFLVPQDSPVMAVLNVQVAKRTACFEASSRLQTKYGATHTYFSPFGRVLGFALPDGAKLPEGWRWEPKFGGVIVPDKRSKVGKQAAQELKELPQSISGWSLGDDLTEALGEEYVWRGDSRWLTPGYEKLGDTWVLTVPSKCRVSPPGCVELKMSEYYALKEVHGGTDEE